MTDYLDACPGCTARNNEPIAWNHTPEGGLTCAYTCNNCHMEWECSWWGRED